MTNEKALEIIENAKPSDAEMLSALCSAAVALEKQIPKKPTQNENGFYHCPTCGHGEYCLMKYKSNYIDPYKYCRECGQRLDWEDECWKRLNG